MTPHEHGETIAELLALRSRIDAHLFAVLADADRGDVAASAGATSTAAWVRAATGVTGAEATRLVRQARTIESHPATHTALAQGEIHTEQATVIVAAVDALPAEVADRAPDAETHLLALAEQHDARALRGLGRQLLEVLAPDQADALIARHLDREETEARKTCFLKTWSDGHGSTYGRFKIPDLTGAILTTAWRPTPTPTGPTRSPERRAAAQVYGQAFCELLEHLPPTGSPDRGSTPRCVTMTLDTLLGGLRPRTSWAPTPCSPPAKPAAGRRSRRHPRRPGQPVPAPRPRSTTHLHPTPTHRHGPPPRRALQHQGLRTPRHLVRRQPPTTLEHWRPHHHRRRRTDLPPTPHPGPPRPPLPQTHISRRETPFTNGVAWVRLSGRHSGLTRGRRSGHDR